jgi:hypothetical protein
VNATISKASSIRDKLICMMPRAVIPYVQFLTEATSGELEWDYSSAPCNPQRSNCGFAFGQEAAITPASQSAMQACREAITRMRRGHER